MQLPMDASLASGLRDNYLRGSVGDFLGASLTPGAEVAIVPAYFTIYAYAALRDQLDTIEHLSFLFGEPRFVQASDPKTPPPTSAPSRPRSTSGFTPFTG